MAQQVNIIVKKYSAAKHQTASGTVHLTVLKSKHESTFFDKDDRPMTNLSGDKVFGDTAIK